MKAKENYDNCLIAQLIPTQGDWFGVWHDKDMDPPEIKQRIVFWALMRDGESMLGVVAPEGGGKDCPFEFAGDEDNFVRFECGRDALLYSQDQIDFLSSGMTVVLSILEERGLCSEENTRKKIAAAQAVIDQIRAEEMKKRGLG